MSTSCSRRRSPRFALALALTFSLAAASWPRPQHAANSRVSGRADASAEAPAAAQAKIEERAREAYGKLGVSFEENRGQADGRVRFLARHGGATVFLTNDEAAFVLSRAGKASDKRPLGEEGSPDALARRERLPERPQAHAVCMKFEGANPRAEVSGERELKGRVNYFRGSDPSQWQTNIKTYGAVRYRGLYDGVDLVYYGNAQGQMEYDFEVAPGADPNQISLMIEGAEGLEVDASGDLVISTPVGQMRQRRPEVFQEVDGARRAVEGGYIAEPGGRVRFALGAYDKGARLIIDPVLEYSVSINGIEGLGIAVDPTGNAYVAGYTYASSGNRYLYDAFVTKLSADGSEIVYSTYLVGGKEDRGLDIAVDSGGAAYVTGSTESNSFPVARPIQRERADGLDAFVTKLNAAGNALVYSTYLGGASEDKGFGIAVDSAGNAYVTGSTVSPDFPTLNAVKNAHSGGFDGFVTKISAAGTALVYSTYLGGSHWDQGQAVAADSQGNAYVTGHTASRDFPVANAIQSTLGGDEHYSDAFVTKLNADGSGFVYSTYLGGNWPDDGSGIAADSQGNAYVTGSTGSPDFPVANAFQGTNGSYPRSHYDAFVTKLNAAGSAFIYSSYLGGRNLDYGSGIAVDSAGNAYVTGNTESDDFPVVNAFKSTKGTSVDAVLAGVSPSGSALFYSTYFGNDDDDPYGYDTGADVAVDSAGNAYFTGLKTIPYQYGSYRVIFVTKFGFRSIRGRVVTQGATGEAGVPWVTIKLTGSQTGTKLTDAEGNYTFTGLARDGDYTITPMKANLSFAPPRRTFNNLAANQEGVNFTVPSLSVTNVTVTELNTAEATATFAVKLKPAGSQPVTVNCQTAGGATNSATSDADYTPLAPTTLTFDPGQTVKTVTVKVKGDILDEPNETFRLLLSAPTNALIADKEGVCTINDNDAAPSLSINNAAVTEGDADVTATFTVTLSAASGQTVKVSYRTPSGTATAPADYTAVGFTTLTFAPGETTKTVSVTVRGDALDEPAETFRLLLSSPANAAVAVGTGTCTITDDD